MGQGKTKRNEKCHCGSGKKYKKCCLSTDLVKQQENKVDLNELYSNGHAITKEMEVMNEYFTEEYPDFKVIDITNVIKGKGSYKSLQTKHYFENTIMLAGRTEDSDNVFDERGDGSTDWMVMFRGAHQVFHNRMFGSMKSQLKQMIDARLKNESYAY